MSVTTNTTSGALLDPLVALEFNETSGTAVNYTGTAVGSFTRSASVPASSTMRLQESFGHHLILEQRLETFMCKAERPSMR